MHLSAAIPHKLQAQACIISSYNLLLERLNIICEFYHTAFLLLSYCHWVLNYMLLCK
jgi:hypothetical protein